jgi:hypothetical protein
LIAYNCHVYEMDPDLVTAEEMHLLGRSASAGFATAAKQEARC